MADARQSIDDRPLGERQFSFAVIADTHLNQAEAECNSPFEVNRLANGRLRHVVQDLNGRELAFVINLGDLVHPVPALPQLYAAAAQRFHEQIEDLRHPIHLVPGNHDVGDKPIDWGPAGVITEAFLDLWTKHFGAHFYAFEQGDCRFFVVNAQLLNSGLDAEAEQRAWLERELARSAHKRTFINIHYPPFLCRADEDEHYDNLAEPGRGWLLDLLNTCRVEALFAGHVHNFWYNRHGTTDCYLLPSTAFVRHDYSEMYRVEPGAEGGRNDTPKLGYFIVHVHENGHVCEVVRTYGQVAEPGSVPAPIRRRVVCKPPRLARRVPLGFDLRQSWAEVLEIPPSGGLDEFDRKIVRNDYPLMALWEMGIQSLRVPLRDLLNESVRKRMRVFREQGHVFTLFSFGPPDETQRRRVAEHADLLSAWEIGFSPGHIEPLADALTEFADISDVPVYLSKLRSKEELEGTGDKYYHLISHGYSPDNTAPLAALFEHPRLSRCTAGAVFRLAAKSPPWQFIIDASELAAVHGRKASVHLRLSGDNPAEALCDDLWTANRLAEALLAASALDNVTVFADAFADVDRGYFVRNGVVDRRYNPRLGLQVVRNLSGALDGWRDVTAIGSGNHPGGRHVAVAQGDTMHLLLLPESGGGGGDTIPLPRRPASIEGDVESTDLVSGEVSRMEVRLLDDQRVQLRHDSLPPNPLLLSFN